MLLSHVFKFRSHLLRQIPTTVNLQRTIKFIVNNDIKAKNYKICNRHLNSNLCASFNSTKRFKTVMTDPNTFKFRRAKDEDMECVINMIKDLATMENMANSCKLSAADLIRDAGKELCHIYVMEDLTLSNTLAGYAICFFSYSTWEGKAYFLEDLYLRPEYRGTGTGELMFREVVSKAHEFGCKRLEFHALEWNPARRFYKRLGCTDLTETERWHYYRLNESQLVEMAEDFKKQRK